jgi:hypothetical protein
MYSWGTARNFGRGSIEPWEVVYWKQSSYLNSDVAMVELTVAVTIGFAVNGYDFEVVVVGQC